MTQLILTVLLRKLSSADEGASTGLAWPQFASGWTTLSESDRLTGAEAIVNAAKGGRTAIVIGVQSREEDFAETERYATHAEKTGADAIICLQPGMVDPTKPIGIAAGELLSFYERLGQLTALPLFAQTVSDFSVDQLMDIIFLRPMAGPRSDRSAAWLSISRRPSSR